MSFLTNEIATIKETGAYNNINDILQIAIFNAFTKGYSLGDVTKMFNDTIHAKTLRFVVPVRVVALEDVSVVTK